tara:strand:- start:639 stop:1388 length:750 start_codon:yes stop_codon:yes gene_type:complete
MDFLNRNQLEWEHLIIGITGASGSLGRALTSKLREKGAFIIGFTHSPISNKSSSSDSPQKWIKWKNGEESAVKEMLKKVNILILNHGINLQAKQSNIAINESIEINALSTWRLIECFEEIAKNEDIASKTREIWVNTSEAEIQPALSPTYEISKKLIGDIVSLKKNNLSASEKEIIKIRKIILGPFRSSLNPIGIMSANFVANQIIKQSEIGMDLIIVTPNPLTYIIMPLVELIRYSYSQLVNKISIGK